MVDLELGIVEELGGVGGVGVTDEGGVLNRNERGRHRWAGGAPVVRVCMCYGFC